MFFASNPFLRCWESNKEQRKKSQLPKQFPEVTTPNKISSIFIEFSLNLNYYNRINPLITDNYLPKCESDSVSIEHTSFVQRKLIDLI